MAESGGLNIRNLNFLKPIEIITYLGSVGHIIVGVLSYLGLVQQTIVEVFIQPSWIYHAVFAVFYFILAIGLSYIRKRL